MECALELRRLSLIDTNITTIQTPFVIGGIDKYKQLTYVKPTQTVINRNK